MLEYFFHIDSTCALTITEQLMHLIDLQFWSKVGVDLFKQVYSSTGNVIISLNYHLKREDMKKCQSFRA